MQALAELTQVFSLILLALLLSLGLEPLVGRLVAAGLGRGAGVAVYSTFLNRAFDQVLMDVALHRLPVTLVLDRAGVTGPDGPSHHGMWDLPILGLVPGMRVGVPRDARRLDELLQEAVARDDGPSALRFPRGAAAPSRSWVEAHRRVRRLAGPRAVAPASPASRCRLLTLGLPPQFLAAGERAGLLRAAGLDGEGIAASVRSALGVRAPTQPAGRFS